MHLAYLGDLVLYVANFWNQLEGTGVSLQGDRSLGIIAIGPDGVVRWTRVIHSEAWALVRDVASRPDGSVLLAGELGTDSEAGAGFEDIDIECARGFVLSINPADGSVEWAVGFHEALSGITTDDVGRYYVSSTLYVTTPNGPGFVMGLE